MDKRQNKTYRLDFRYDIGTIVTRVLDGYEGIIIDIHLSLRTGTAKYDVKMENGSIDTMYESEFLVDGFEEENDDDDEIEGEHIEYFINFGEIAEA
jgi:hypothetical protein